ncbi:MAG: hypothetical protein ACI4XS_13880 [Bacillus sp. (in: firmicutes)]
MKKTLFAIGLTSLLLAGCTESASEDNSNQDVLQETVNTQAEQLKEYEATISEQKKQIEELTEEVASLKETSGNTEESSNGQANAKDFIVLFQGDDTASYVYPTIQPYNKEDDLVKTIHNFISKGYDIGLNSYRFEDDGKLLVLDYDENAKNVQGSAGTGVFLTSMTDSYFANFPELIGIKLLLNGDGKEEVIGQSGSNEIFVREPFSYDPDIEW